MRKAFLMIFVLTTMYGCTQKNKQYTFKTYFSSGKVKAVTEMCEGKKDGVEKLYLEDGNLFMIQNFKDDLPVDSFFQYHNGQIVLKGFCIPRSHTVVLDATDNEIIGENDYKTQAVPDGIAKLYFKNGKVASIREYKNGKKNGVYIMYFFNGQVMKIQHYNNGVEVPPSIIFDSTGKMLNLAK